MAATEDVPKTFATISVSDVDVGAGQLQVSLTANNGTVMTLGTTSGLAFSVGDGIADDVMTFTGTLVSLEHRAERTRGHPAEQLHRQQHPDHQHQRPGQHRRRRAWSRHRYHLINWALG